MWLLVSSTSSFALLTALFTFHTFLAETLWIETLPRVDQRLVSFQMLWRFKDSVYHGWRCFVFVIFLVIVISSRNAERHFTKERRQPSSEPTGTQISWRIAVCMFFNMYVTWCKSPTATALKKNLNIILYGGHYRVSNKVVFIYKGSCIILYSDSCYCIHDY